MEEFTTQLDRLTSFASEAEQSPRPQRGAARLQHILVAVDASPASSHVIEWAIHLAKANRGEILVVHVVPHASTLAAAGAPYGAPLAPDMEAMLEATGRALLQEAAERVMKADVPVDSLLARGGPARAIVEAAKTHASDVIIVGARGLPRGIPRLGSVARGVLHHARSHVLLARGPPRLSKVLAATDGSDESKIACETAGRIALAHDAQLAIVHVVDAAARDMPVPDVEVPLREGLHASYRVKFGDAVECILDESEDRDLVVIGSRGLTGFKSLVLGSVSDSVSRLAGCSVLVVKRAAIEP